MWVYHFIIWMWVLLLGMKVWKDIFPFFSLWSLMMGTVSSYELCQAVYIPQLTFLCSLWLFLLYRWGVRTHTAQGDMRHWEEEGPNSVLSISKAYVPKRINLQKDKLSTEQISLWVTLGNWDLIFVLDFSQRELSCQYSTVWPEDNNSYWGKK